MSDQTDYELAVESCAEDIITEINEQDIDEDVVGDVIHEFVDYDANVCYDSVMNDIIISYGLTKAMEGYNDTYGQSSPTSRALLYHILSEGVWPIIQKHYQEKEDEE